jgi:hypothetical protein
MFGQMFATLQTNKQGHLDKTDVTELITNFVMVNVDKDIHVDSKFQLDRI